ncbi:MAG: ATP-dependent DNA helicase RecG [Bacteriovoracaceae bacterium]
MKSSPLNINSPLTDWYKGKKVPKAILQLKKVNIVTIFDLLWILPNRILHIPKSEATLSSDQDQFIRGSGKIIKIIKVPSQNSRFRKVKLCNLTVIVADTIRGKNLNLKWFNVFPSFVDKLDKIEGDLNFYGKTSIYNNQLQIINPEILKVEKTYHIEYPITNYVTSDAIEKYINKIDEEVWSQLDQLIDPNILHKNNFFKISEAFKILHGKTDITHTKKAKETLIFCEFIWEREKKNTNKVQMKKFTAKKMNLNPDRITYYLNGLPYALTNDQQKSFTDIQKDLASGSPMIRLLQGDVGCGKTTIAFLSAFVAIENGSQVAFMCPTETLASQHYTTLLELLKNLKNSQFIKPKLLVGSLKQSEKNLIAKELKTNQINFIIGTHALIQKNIQFHNLGLVIIDEQHKFGVLQRNELLNKGINTHCLTMTATPIPRSLNLTIFGDLDISIIREKPSIHKKIPTRIVTEKTFAQFLNFVFTRLNMGEQVYVVVPSIFENETNDLYNIEKAFTEFSKYFPDIPIGCLHGELNAEEKNTIFQDFNNNKTKILISTSIIEVGINIHNASVMCILNPERFGLSSLHQLRGRVGRGKKSGFCFLIVDQSVSETALNKLRVIERNDDGFVIAEEDLKLRGSGDLLGLNQSGFITPYKLADITLHQELLELANTEFSKPTANLSYYHTIFSSENSPLIS